MKAGHVVVVGGGLAGITAALDCADAGAGVTLLEVRPRLGGAAYSFERDGRLLDNGQHVFLRCCTAYRALLERLGSSSGTVLQRRLAIPVLAPGGRLAWLRRADLPAPLHLAPALGRYGHLTAAERARAATAAAALRTLDPDDPETDRRSFGAWLADHGQSAHAVRALWDLICLPTLNLRASEASLAQAAFVFQVGLLGARDAGDIGWARGPLAALHDEPAHRALAAAGCRVRLARRAERIEPLPHGGLVVLIGDERLEADAVVLAVPHDRAARLLPREALPDPTALARLGRSPIVNVHVDYDRPVVELPLLAALHPLVQFAFARPADDGGQRIAVSLSGAEREMAMRQEALRDAVLASLAELLPAARSARVRDAVVVREPSATFRAAPGARSLRPGAQTAVRGLALAGAWTDTGWPATMEGAVRSGHAAAAVALAAVRRARLEPPVAAVRAEETHWRAIA